MLDPDPNQILQVSLALIIIKAGKFRQMLKVALLPTSRYNHVQKHRKAWLRFFLNETGGSFLSLSLSLPFAYTQVFSLLDVWESIFLAKKTDFSSFFFLSLDGSSLGWG